MAPNQETNTKLVSDVLSDALTRLFRRCENDPGADPPCEW
ncbi:hypothetical protein ACQKP9_29375, partial [Pseudomonas mandelii]